MFGSLSLPILILIFVVAAAVVWVSGKPLSDSTDVLSTRFGLGQALGGLVLLGIATNLPEIAIVVSAALGKNVGIATGDILGGIAIQTVVLAILDLVSVAGPQHLTYRAAALELVLEGALVVAVLTVTIMATQLPPSLVFARVAPGGFATAAIWVAGIWLVSKARHDLPWPNKGIAPGSEQARRTAGKAGTPGQVGKGKSTARMVLVFAAGAVATLVAGAVLERSGTVIAGRIGMSGVLFGATVLGATTSLPELATGIAAVKLQDYHLTMSDILGGNAFLPVLFLPASIISGQAVLPRAHATDIYLTALGILLTAIYIAGLVFRPRSVRYLGLDSLGVVLAYAIGVAGLFAVAHG